MLGMASTPVDEGNAFWGKSEDKKRGIPGDGNDTRVFKGVNPNAPTFLPTGLGKKLK